MPKRIPRYVGEHIAVAYLALLAAAALAFLVLGIGYVQQNNRTKELAQESNALAKTSLDLSHQIQVQRRQTLFTACRVQNEHHLVLTRFLREQGLERNEKNKLAYEFIDKLAPVQNCRKLVRAATTSGR